MKYPGFVPAKGGLFDFLTQNQNFSSSFRSGISTYYDEASYGPLLIYDRDPEGARNPPGTIPGAIQLANFCPDSGL